MRVIHVLKKPVSESSVTKNVLKHGTGGLNVDAGRISNGEQPKPTTAPGWDSYNKANAEQGYRDKDYAQGPAEYHPSPDGRWPANMVFRHHPECVLKGTKQVKSSNPGNKIIEGGASTGVCYGDYGRRSAVGHEDADGKETVPAWDCAPGCPVAALDIQSDTSRFFKQVGDEK